MVRAITTREEFDQVASPAEDKLIVVDFFANWCGPCLTIAPKFAQLAEQTPDVIFLKVDCDEAEALREHYGITKIPTFFFMKKAVVLDTLVGPDDISEIEQKIQQYK
jgi:thioredoxin 1